MILSCPGLFLPFLENTDASVETTEPKHLDLSENSAIKDPITLFSQTVVVLELAHSQFVEITSKTLAKSVTRVMPKIN